MPTIADHNRRCMIPLLYKPCPADARQGSCSNWSGILQIAPSADRISADVSLRTTLAVDAIVPLRIGVGCGLCRRGVFFRFCRL